MQDNIEFSRQVLLKRARQPQAAIAIYPETVNTVVRITSTATALTFIYGSTQLSINYVGKSIAEIVANINRSNIPVRAIALSKATHLETGEFLNGSSKLIPYEFPFLDRISNNGVILRITRFTVKHNNLSRIRLLEPYKDSVTQPWFPVIGIGSFTQEYRNRTFHFSVPEFVNQAWSTRYGRPFKDLKSVTPTVIANNVFQLPRYPIHYVNNNMVFYNGDTLLNTSIIEDVDIYNGKVYIKPGIYLSNEITVDYTYLETSYVYPYVNINGHFSQNPQLLDKFVVMYAVPSESSIGITNNRTIFHSVADSIDEAIDSIEIQDIDYPVAIIGAYNIQQVYSSDRATIVDTRSKGGGLIEFDGPKSPVHNIDSVLDQETNEVPIESVREEAKSFWDIGRWDGQPYPGAAAVLVELPSELRDVLPEQDIQNKATKFLAAGVYPVIRYSERDLPSTGDYSRSISLMGNLNLSGSIPHIELGPELLVNTGFTDINYNVGPLELSRNSGLLAQHTSNSVGKSYNRSISGWFVTGDYFLKIQDDPYSDLIPAFINTDMGQIADYIINNTIIATGYNGNNWVIGIMSIADRWTDGVDDYFIQTGVPLQLNKNYKFRLRAAGGGAEFSGSALGVPGLSYYDAGAFGTFKIGGNRPLGINPSIIGYTGNTPVAYWNPLSGQWLSSYLSGNNYIPVQQGRVRKYAMTFPTSGFPGATPTSFALEFRGASWGNLAMFDGPSIREVKAINITGAEWNILNRTVPAVRTLNFLDYTDDPDMGPAPLILKEKNEYILEVSPGSGVYQNYIKSTPHAGIEWEERSKVRFANSSRPDDSFYTSWEKKRTIDKRPVPTGQLLKGVLSFESNFGVRQIKNISVSAPYRVDTTGEFLDELGIALIDIQKNTTGLSHGIDSASTVSKYMTAYSINDITNKGSLSNISSYYGYPQLYNSLYNLSVTKLSGYYEPIARSMAKAMLSGMSFDSHLFRTYHVSSGIYYSATGLQTIAPQLKMLVDFTYWGAIKSGVTSAWYLSGLSGIRSIYSRMLSGLEINNFTYFAPDFYVSGDGYPTPRSLNIPYYNETDPTGSEDHRLTEILPTLASIWALPQLSSGNLNIMTGLPYVIQRYYTGLIDRALVAITGDRRILGATGLTNWQNNFDRYGQMAGQFASDIMHTYLHLHSGYNSYLLDTTGNFTNIGGTVITTLVSGLNLVLDAAYTGVQESLTRNAIIDVNTIKLLAAYGMYAVQSIEFGNTLIDSTRAGRYYGLYVTGMRSILRSMITTEGNIYETTFVDGGQWQYTKTPPSLIFDALAQGYQIDRDVFIPIAQGILKTTVANHSHGGSYPYDGVKNYLTGGFEERMLPNLTELYVAASDYHPAPDVSGLVEGRVSYTRHGGH